MIDQQIIQQLQNSEPEIRKRAIRALAKTHDYQALQYLATVHRRDTDPDVRDLAYKAAKYLRQHVSKPESDSADATYTSPGDVSAIDVGVSPMQIARAKRYVDQAMDWHVRQDDVKASEFLTKAFIANPQLMEDTFTVGIAENITNFRGKEAVRAVMRATRTDEDVSNIKGKNKRKKSQFGTHHFNTTDQTFIGAVIFCGVLLLVGFNMAWIRFPLGALFGDDATGFDFSVTAFELVRGLEESGGIGFGSLMIYSLWLVPIAGFAHIGIGAYYFAMRVKPDKTYWRQGVTFSFLSLIPVGWLYLDISADSQYIEIFGLSTIDFLGTGFFIGLVVGLISLGISFMGLQSD